MKSFFQWVSRLPPPAVIALSLTVGWGVLMIPMFLNSYPHTHSYYFNMMWAFEYAQQFWGGQWYPRWLEGSFFGLGNPTFVFYPPLCMVAVLPFAGLGAGPALVGSMSLAVLVRGIGCYRLARCLWARPVAAGVALVGMAAPYFLLDVFVRGAIAEVWAISLMPWMIWAGLKWIRHPSWLSLPLIVTTALMGLTHLPTLLIWMTLWWVWPFCFVPAFFRRSVSQIWEMAGSFGLSTVVGLAIDSFFLLPAQLDQQWVSIELINGWDIYNPLTRFILAFWPHLYSTEKDEWLRIQFWLVLGVGVLAIGFSLGQQLFSRPPQVVPLQEQKGIGFQGLDPEQEMKLVRTRALIFCGLALVVSSVMMTDLSAWVYQGWPTLQRIQFPWRWQAITTTLLPVWVGFLLSLAGSQSGWRRGLAVAVSVGLAGWITWQGIQVTLPLGQGGKTLYNPVLTADFDARMRQRPPFPQEPQVDPQRADHYLAWHWAYPEGIAFIDAFEYRPRTATGNVLPPPRTYPLVEWQTGQGDLNPSVWQYGFRRIQVEATIPGQILLRTFAYPAWQVKVNGIPTPLSASGDGRLRVEVPVGASTVEVFYRGTWAERWGTALTWILVIAVSVQGIRQQCQKRSSLNAFPVG